MNEPEQAPHEPHDKRRPSVKQGNPAGALIADLNRYEAVKLRLKGWTFKKIGEELGVSDKTAHEYVNEYWEKLKLATDEDRGELRELMNARLEAAIAPLMAILLATDLVVVSVDRQGNEVREESGKLVIQAANALAKMVTVQAKLLGLNAPEKLEINDKTRRLESLQSLAARVLESRARQAALSQGGSKS